jgi:hypothetical protein
LIDLVLAIDEVASGKQDQVLTQEEFEGREERDL